jgi:hypothetical protein
MNPERLAAYRKLFAHMSTDELRAMAEGRKPHKLGEEGMEAMCLVLAERAGGGQGTAGPTGVRNIRREPVLGQQSSVANRPSLPPKSERYAAQRPGAPRGRTSKGRIAVIAFVILATIGLLPVTRDELRWRLASKRDTPQAYSRYLAAWPGGRHATEAKARSEELDWQEAINANTIRAIQFYVRKYPEGRFLAEAATRVEELEWQQADDANTIRAVQAYLQRRPAGRFQAEAQARIAALRVDERPFAAALREGTESALYTFLNEFPGHAKERAVHQALSEIRDGRDIVDLLSEKKIEVQTQGSGIEAVALSLRRLVSYPLTVRIPVGTYFVSANPASQNMVTTAESKVQLSADGWQKASTSVACANRPKKIPGKGDTFSVTRSPHQAELARLMPVLDRARAGYPTQQAAVWIVTDDADYSDLGSLETTTQVGFSTTISRTIRETDAAQAMKICWESGIDITRKRIWRDRVDIWRNVQNAELKNWLEGKQ